MVSSQRRASWPAARRLPAEFTGPLWCRRGVKTTPIAVPNAAGESGWGLTRVLRGLRFSEAGAKIAFGLEFYNATYRPEAKPRYAAQAAQERRTQEHMA